MDAAWDVGCKKPIQANEVACAEHLEDALTFQEHVEKHSRVCKQNGYAGYGGSCCDRPGAMPKPQRTV